MLANQKACAKDKSINGNERKQGTEIQEETKMSRKPFS